LSDPFAIHIIRDIGGSAALIMKKRATADGHTISRTRWHDLAYWFGFWPSIEAGYANAGSGHGAGRPELSGALGQCDQAQSPAVTATRLRLSMEVGRLVRLCGLVVHRLPEVLMERPTRLATTLADGPNGATVCCLVARRPNNRQFRRDFKALKNANSAMGAFDLRLASAQKSAQSMLIAPISDLPSGPGASLCLQQE
jgi:hypothetical protein